MKQGTSLQSCSSEIEPPAHSLSAYSTTIGENSEPRRPRIRRFRGHGSRRGNLSTAGRTGKPPAPSS